MKCGRDARHNPRPSRHENKAQAEFASGPSEAFGDTMHSHSDKIEKVSAMHFGAEGQG